MMKIDLNNVVSILIDNDNINLKGAAVPWWDEYRITYHNIKRLPSKFDDMKILLDCRNSIGAKNRLDRIDGYNFVCRNRIKPRGG